MTEPFIFVSYRRNDASPYALALKAELEHRLRSALVFVDVQRMQATDRWPEVLEHSLSRARVLIALVGTRWMECEECSDRSRLFDPGDWVRKEIGFFLRRNSLAIVPALVDGAHTPPSPDLPKEIAELADIQAIRLEPGFWNESIANVVSILTERFGFEAIPTSTPNPGRSAFRGLAPPLDQSILDAALSKFLCGWRLESRYDRIGLGATTQWLVKTYKFPSFGAAMAFMKEGAAACESLNHHPTWEYCFKEVKVNLSTWNAGHRITQYDVDLAMRFDKLASTIIN
jgi:pterin-4a-carbinolamine dehydratase